MAKSHVPSMICMGSPLAGNSMQPQKRTVKHILIRYGRHGYSAKIHALRLCSHVRFCVRDGHLTVSCQGRAFLRRYPLISLHFRNRNMLLIFTNYNSGCGYTSVGYYARVWKSIRGGVKWLNLLLQKDSMPAVLIADFGRRRCLDPSSLKGYTDLLNIHPVWNTWTVGFQGG